MKKILVTGAAGLFGINFCLASCRTSTIIGVTRRFIKGLPFETIQTDLLEKGAFAKAVEKIRPDVVIHAAANANLEDCERDPQATYLLNATLPGQIAEITAQRGIQLLHISTDAVFYDSGDRVFSEDDTPNPINVYGKSKLEGEQNVLQADPYSIVARVNFFGWSMTGQKSLAEFFFNNLSVGKPCFGFSDVFFCPMYTEDLTETFHQMLNKQLAGLFHTVGSQTLSKYAFGQHLARVFGFDETLISAQKVDLSTLSTPRSHNLRLNIHKLSTALGSNTPSYQQGLDRFYLQYKHGYPQKLQSYQQ